MLRDIVRHCEMLCDVVWCCEMLCGFVSVKLQSLHIIIHVYMVHVCSCDIRCHGP